MVKTSCLYNSDKSFVLRKHLFAHTYFNSDIQKACWTYLTIALTGAESRTQLQDTTIPGGESMIELLDLIRYRFDKLNREFGFWYKEIEKEQIQDIVESMIELLNSIRCRFNKSNWKFWFWYTEIEKYLIQNIKIKSYKNGKLPTVHQVFCYENFVENFRFDLLNRHLIEWVFHYKLKDVPWRKTNIIHLKHTKKNNNNRLKKININCE